jgi:hypothetical protein
VLRRYVDYFILPNTTIHLERIVTLGRKPRPTVYQNPALDTVTDKTLILSPVPPLTTEHSRIWDRDHPPNPLYTPSQNSVFALLPPELIGLTVEYLLNHSREEVDSFFANDEDPTSLVISRDHAIQKQLSSLLAVNQRWHAALVPLLYWRPIILGPKALRTFRTTLDFGMNRAQSVRQLVLVDRTGDEDIESFYSLAYCGDSGTQEQTQDALINLMTCREPGTLSVVFITSRSPFFDGCAYGASLLKWTPSKISKSVNTVNATACTAITSLRSLTLHGFASHLMYTPSSDWFDMSSMAFSSLEELKLDSMMLRDLHWPCMPSLNVVIVTRCRFTKYSLPSLQCAPQLRSITLESVLSPNNQDSITTMIPFIIAHGSKLISLTIPYGLYEALLTIFNWHRDFPVLRELAIGKTSLNPQDFWSTTQQDIPAWTEGVFPKTFPSKLGVFRLTGHQKPFLEVLVVFDPVYAKRALARNVVHDRPQEWGHLRIGGQETFWNQVPSHVQVEAEATCKATRRQYVCAYADFGRSNAYIHDPHRLTVVYHADFEEIWHLKPLCAALARQLIPIGMIVWQHGPVPAVR